MAPSTDWSLMETDTEGFDRFVTSTATPIVTGWSDSCRVGLIPTGRAHVFTAHGHQG